MQLPLFIFFRMVEVLCILHDRKVLMSPTTSSEGESIKVTYWRIHPKYRWLIDFALTGVAIYASCETFQHPDPCYQVSENKFPVCPQWWSGKASRHIPVLVMAVW
jgi:hypothetical protein